MEVKGLQFLHQVVKVEEGAEGLGVMGLIHSRREENKCGVVLALRRLPKLGDGREREREISTKSKLSEGMQERERGIHSIHQEKYTKSD